jgi:sulfate adenylyltransferase
MEQTNLIPPYRGNLVDLITKSVEAADLFSYAASLPSIQLSKRETCDLELLATGAFSPLRSFMSELDYCGVLREMRLSDGTVFPIPVTISVDDLTNIQIGVDIALRDRKNELLASMTVEEIYEWDREFYAESVVGTNDPRHPLVAEMREWGRFNLSGKLRVIKLPESRDFEELRLTPKQTRTCLEKLGYENVVAFQTRNPIHRAHEAAIQKAMERTDGSLLLHPVVGMTKNGDIDHFTRVRTYKAVANFLYPKDRVLLSLLPLAMRFAGPREAVWHAIIRRNYGANHMIVGRDHASPGKDSNGKPYYEPDAAHKLASDLSSEIGVNIIAFDEFTYLPEEKRYEEVQKVTNGHKSVNVSASSIRKDFLEEGRVLPEWLARSEVAKILSESFPPRESQGVCLWFTGLSGSGKSTTAEIVTSFLLEEGRRTTLLDGDIVRTHLSKDLGFSKEDRDINIRRIGFVASEIVRHGGIAVCAAVSPYRQSRSQVRLMFNKANFVEIFVDTPLEICEGRDPKGMYAKARRGAIANFTGVSDVYELPRSPEITLNTVDQTAKENARFIIEHLRSKGFLTPRALSANSYLTG